AENIKKYSDTNVTIIEKSDHLIAPLDKDIASILHNTLRKNNINIILNNGVNKIEENNNEFNILLDNGMINADYIILAIGVKPETKLAKEANIEINLKGSIITDEHM